MKEETIKQKLELIEEAIADWKDGKLQDFSALVAINIIVNNAPPSKEVIEWAIKSILMKKGNEI
jgi:hypothetical protein